jgi:hypothetical protein
MALFRLAPLQCRPLSVSFWNNGEEEHGLGMGCPFVQTLLGSYSKGVELADPLQVV